MQDKNSHNITNRQVAFFFGIALVLMTAICVLNMWVVARAISFPFVYAFGISNYLIFAYLFIEGLALIIKRKTIGLKFSLRTIGFILILASSTVLLNSFIRPTYSMATYHEFFNGLNYINEPKFLNLFELPIAGGFVGVAIFELLNNIAEPIPFIIGFMVLFVGFMFVFMNPILSLIANHQAKKGDKPKKEKPKKVKKSEKEVKTGTNEINIPKDYSNDVIRDASSMENVPLTTPKPVPPEPIPLSPSDLSGPVSTDMTFRNNGVFVPAHFVPGVIPGDNPNSVMTSAKPPISSPEPINPPTPPVNPKPEIPAGNERSEQLTLDFDNSPKVDENIVTAQPVFEQPVSTSRPTSVETPTPANPPKKKIIKWIPPSTELLETYETSEASNINIETAEQRMALINQIFVDYKIGAKVVGYTIGPSVTRYNVDYHVNVQTKAVENLVKDIARRLGGVMVRFEAIVAGSEYSGLEIPNARVTMVSFKDVYEALPDVKKEPCSVAFGKNIQGDVITTDFRGFPHILVAGTTGSGKSVFVHSLISTLIMRNSPNDLKLILVDPKRVEMVKYRDIPHLLCPIINDPNKAKPLLDKLVDEMNHRYDILAQGDGFSDIKDYNEYAEENGLEKIPTIVCILDEYGDLVETCKEISRPVLLIGQKARAAGIHMLIATQSPTSDIITGPIKSNLPTHVALSTSSSTQSVTIIGEGGAEKLLGKGDMLVQCAKVNRGTLTRLQGCYISNKEISRICGFLRDHYEPQYDDNFMNLEEEETTVDGQLFVANGGMSQMGNDAQEEAKYQSIKEWVMAQQYTSMSRIQGDCGVGFNRARRFFNRLVQEGIVSPTSEGNRGCKVLVHDPRSEIDPDDIPTSDEQTD